MLSPGGVKDNPGISPSVSHRGPVGQLLLGSSSGPYLRPRPSALHPSLRGSTEPGPGRHPRGCSHKDATCELAKLPESSQAGGADGRARERTKSESRGALGVPEDAGAES